MAEIESLVSSLLKGISSKFGSKVKKLDDIPLDDLNREVIRLENARAPAPIGTANAR
jgi:hypothetical protein